MRSSVTIGGQEQRAGSHVGEMCAAEVSLTEWVSHSNKRFHHQISELEDWFPECILEACPLETFAIQRTIIWYSLKWPTAEKDQKDMNLMTLLLLTHFKLKASFSVVTGSMMGHQTWQSRLELPIQMKSCRKWKVSGRIRLWSGKQDNVKERATRR